MAKTKKPAAKPAKFNAKPAAKAAPKAAPKAAAKPSKAPVRVATPTFAGVVKAMKAAKPGERVEIPAPDFQEWWDNLKAYAYKSPAALVVGIIAVWMALVLLFD